MKTLNEKGISLVEVIAGIVIITIILLSFSQLLIQSNKAAVANNEKLDTIQLADATLEQLKNQSSINLRDHLPTTNTCLNIPIDSLPIVMDPNYNKYSFTACATLQSTSEKELDLVNIKVKVVAPNNQQKSSIEGFVNL